MEQEFICLFKLGVGPISIRFSEIIVLEPTLLNNTKIDLSTGNTIIVAEDVTCILTKIKTIQQLNEQIAKVA